jgi:hypothetical protein
MAGRSRPGGLTALLIVMTSAVTPMAVAQDALGTIDSCVRKLNTDVDVGYERIAARCPELIRRLDDSGWSGWLPRDWKQPGNDLSAGSLRELRVLITRELATHRVARAPRIERLNSVLMSLERMDHERRGWWARTQAWLRDVFERREQTSDDGWLNRMIAQIGASQAVLELIAYAALALVVLLAGFIVVNELRSGVVFGEARGRQATRRAPPGTNRRDGLTWDDVQMAAFRHKPRLLLELIATRLTEESCLPPARGLTVRELTRAARLPDERDRERLAELALASERVRFSDTEVSADNIEAAVESGRTLLERISARAADLQSGRP